MKRTGRKKQVAPSMPLPRRGGLSFQQFEALLLGSALALIVATPLIPSESAARTGTHVVPVMAWLFLPLAWLGGNLYWRQSRCHVGVTTWVVLLFLVTHSLSAIAMMRAGHGRPSLNAMWLWISFGIAFLAIRQLAQSPEKIRAVVSAMIALAVGLSALAVYQYRYSMPEQRAMYASNPEKTLRELGIPEEPDSPERRHYEDRLAATEPIGPFELTNSLAGFLTPWFVVLVGIVGSMGRRRERRRKHLGGATLGAFAALAAMAACLMLTKSRSAYLAIFVGFGVLGVSRIVSRRGMRLSRHVWRHHAWRWWGAGAVLTAALIYASFRVGGWDRQVLTEAPKSVLYRIQYWQATSAMIVDHPWFGCGPGNFQGYYAQYKMAEASETIADPHNFLFEVAATAGLPALVLFVMIGVAVVVQVRRLPGESQDQSEPGSATAVLPNEPRDRSVKAVYGGMAVGGILAFPAGWAGGFSPDLALLWVSAPATGIVLWSLHPWVCRGRLKTGPLMIAILALLINLLAAGGVGFPGVGIVLWVLLALILNVADRDKSVGSRQGHTQEPGGRAAVISAAVVSVLMVGAAYLTMYRPVLETRRLLGDAKRVGPREAEVKLRAATAADPWWSEPCEELAHVVWFVWTQRPSKTALEEYMRAYELAIERNPHSNELCRRYGDGLIRMNDQAGDPQLVDLAVSAYARAVELCPNSSLLHAQLAWAYHLARQPDLARHEADEAIRLDEVMRRTPHSELVLARQKLVGIWSTDGADNAEQRMHSLRKVNHGG